MEDIIIGDRVEVLWSDIEMSSGWDEFEHDRRPQPCSTIGYLAGNNGEAISLAQTRPEDPSEECTDYWGNIITIPKGVVKDVMKLNPPNKG